MRISVRPPLDPARLQMSSMIDIVFLLLVFFVMTFQVVALEGDLDVSTPARSDDVDRRLPRNVVLHVRLLSGRDGALAGVLLGQRELPDADTLNSHVRHLVQEHLAAGGQRDELSAQLYTDRNLLYQHTVSAITALRGFVVDGTTHPLIQQVRLQGSEYRSAGGE